MAALVSAANTEAGSKHSSTQLTILRKEDCPIPTLR
jgi:hypothetical protein